MKKLLALSSILGLLLVGCLTDYTYVSTYKYTNNTDSDIIVTSYSVALGGDSTFVISSGGSHSLDFWGDGYSPPFRWGEQTRNSKDSLIIENRGRKIVQKFRYNEKGNLYTMDVYTLIKERKPHHTYEHIFTDEFFNEQ